MRRTAIVLFACISLAGCAPLYWVRADTSAEQIDKDIAQCRSEAWREARLPSFHRPSWPTVVYDRHGRPMLLAPHSPLHDPLSDRALVESRLMRFCMHAKGYALMKAEEIAALR